MPKHYKKKSNKPPMQGAFGPGQTSLAGRIARQPGAFSKGVNPRVTRAQGKVQELVGQGYRLNPNAKTSSTYKSAVRSAGSAAGRLKKLFR